LDLNEFGDFLAGAFAPLAFLWLVLAVILQSAELKDQRIALIAQLEESQTQTKMLVAEQAMANARTNNEKFLAILKILRSKFRHFRFGSGTDEGGDVAYFTDYGEAKITGLERAIVDEREGNIPNDHHRGRVEITLKHARELIGYIEDLKSLNRSLKGHDLELFKACHIPRLIEALELLEESSSR
jgi:hypothetical protein